MATEKTLAIAIYQHCLECMGGNKVFVEQCVSSKYCKLHPVRLFYKEKYLNVEKERIKNSRL